jgi:hypothetical protein
MLRPSRSRRWALKARASERPPGQGTARLHLGEDPLMDQIEELRHAGEDRDRSRLEGLEERGRVDRLEEDHTRARRQWQEKIGHLREGVEERKHAEHGVFLGDVDDRQRARALGLEVGMRQDDPLGVGGRAGGVEDYGRIVGFDRRYRRVMARGRSVRREQRDSNRCAGQVAQRVCRGVLEPVAGQDDPGPAVEHDRPDLGRRVRRVEWHGDGAGTGRPGRRRPSGCRWPRRWRRDRPGRFPPRCRARRPGGRTRRSGRHN